MVSFEEIFGLAMHFKHIEDLMLSLRTSFNGVLLVELYFDKEQDNKDNKDKTKTNNGIDIFNDCIIKDNKKRKHNPTKNKKYVANTANLNVDIYDILTEFIN